MNYIELMETIKDEIGLSSFNKLNEDFLEGYRNEYKNIKVSKSVMEKAIEKYIESAKIKDKSGTGVYCDGITILLTDRGHDKEKPDVDIAGRIKEIFEDRKPTYCYFWDSIALYKALKKQEKKDRYFLKIDGHLYNAELVEKMLACISTSKENYVEAHIGKRGELILKSSYAAIVLPISGDNCPIDQNVNSQDFLKWIDGIKKEKYMGLSRYDN